MSLFLKECKTILKSPVNLIYAAILVSVKYTRVCTEGGFCRMVKRYKQNSAIYKGT
jgi:hypothetical protein